MDSDLQPISAAGVPPKSRVLDAKSLNSIVKKLIELDAGSALARMDIQSMIDGKPPYDDAALAASGQGDRSNLNFLDGKARVKSENAGYYDIMDSVPTLAYIQTSYGDPSEREEWNQVMSEEFHRMLKDWKQFDMRHQLLVQKMTSHGMGFLYFRDDLDWKWEVSGLEDFKIPRGVELSEDEVEVAVALRDVPVGKLYGLIRDVVPGDPRWNLKEVHKALLNASDGTEFSDGAWEKYQETLKNNDVFASATAREVVRVAHVWVTEFSGKVSQFLTLRDGSNTDFLFKVVNRFDNASQCYTFFPFEVGTNGTLHSVRGLGHEIYPPVQVLNTLRNQTVDNAKLSGSLLLQPKTETDAQDMAILFFGGAAYIPPNVTVQNGNLANPSATMLPVIQDMKLSMRSNTGDVPSNQPESQRDKTKFEVQSELTKESVLPTAALNLFYHPWKRHLAEVWRRVKRKGVKKTDPGGEAILDFRKRCLARLVPAEAIDNADNIEPVRAVGFGSPSSRLLAFDEFLQFYGSLDPIGQNNLLRDRFAQKVGYAQVDRYVPRIVEAGRMPVDVEIAELQNAALSLGMPVSVVPNSNHIIHADSHLSSLEGDLDSLESGEPGQYNPQLLASAQAKAAHTAEHLKLLKPDKLQKALVAELTRRSNNAFQRVEAATEAAEVAAAEAEQEQQQQPGQPSAKEQMMLREHEMKMQHKAAEGQQDLELGARRAEQKASITDAEAAARLRSEAARARFRSVVSQPGAPAGSPEIPVA